MSSAAERGGVEEERVKVAAIRLNGEKGPVYTGHMHADAVVEAQKEYPGFLSEDVPQEEWIPFESGFVTTTGRFVSREEAMEIAKKNNQAVNPKAKGLEAEYLKPE